MSTVADSTEPPVRSGFGTSEFRAMAVKAVVSLAALAVVLFRLDPGTPAGIAGVVAAYVAWLGSSSLDLTAFTRSRTAIKTEAIAAAKPG